MGLEVVGVTRPVGARAEHLALATATGAAAWVTVEQLAPDDDKVLADWLSDADRPKVLHDAKGQAHALAAQGWTLSGVVADTALATYLVKPDQRAYDLADLSVRYLHRELLSGERRLRPALLRRRRRRGGRGPAGATPRSTSGVSSRRSWSRRRR